MSFEAAAGALGGPPASRAHALLDEARAWAAKVDDRLAEPYVALGEGTVAMLCGRWREVARRAAMPPSACSATTASASRGRSAPRASIAMSCLLHLGQFNELRPRLARALDEADRRGDLYAATELRTGAAAGGVPDGRSGSAARARCWPGRRRRACRSARSRMLHWQHMQSSALVELYAGAPGKAVELIDRRLPAIRRALPVPDLRGAGVHRVRAIRGAARRARRRCAPSPARLRAAIQRRCDRPRRRPGHPLGDAR